jgi:hypothetical protein
MERRPFRGGDADGLTVQTAAEVRRVFVGQRAQLTVNPDLDPARKAGLLAQRAPIAVEDGTLEARVAAIEAALQRRTDHPRADGMQSTNARTPNEPQSTNAPTLVADYRQFTAEERLRLILAQRRVTTAGRSTGSTIAALAEISLVQIPLTRTYLTLIWCRSSIDSSNGRGLAPARPSTFCNA